MDDVISDLVPRVEELSAEEAEGILGITGKGATGTEGPDLVFWTSTCPGRVATSFWRR